VNYTDKLFSATILFQNPLQHGFVFCLGKVDKYHVHILNIVMHTDTAFLLILPCCEDHVGNATTRGTLTGFHDVLPQHVKGGQLIHDNAANYLSRPRTCRCNIWSDLTQSLAIRSGKEIIAAYMQNRLTNSQLYLVVGLVGLGLPLTVTIRVRLVSAMVSSRCQPILHICHYCI